MKKVTLRILAIFAIFAFVLAACAPATETPTEMPEPTEEPMEETEEPMEETEEPMEETEEPMDGMAIDCMGVEEGTEITMLYQWSGAEEENLNQILQPFIDACGVNISPESTRDQALLDTRVQAGTPPDIAFWNVTQLQQYQDQLFAMPDLGVVQDNYPQFWVDFGSVNGQWLGLPVKADPKTLIWYSPANFEDAGYAVPDSWDGLNELVEQMVSDDRTPWSMGFESGDATGWTGTDFIQDILLVREGPDYVRGILDGSIPYNDEGVREAWEIYGEWASNPEYTPGGASGTVETGFNDAILLVFSDPPEAMMVKQSGFAGGTITETYPDLEYGTGYGFFGVPDAQGLQGGSDWMMAFSDSPAVQALVGYLSSDLGGQTWAEVGFDLTPNLAGRDNYPNQALTDRANILYNADDFVPDIGDSIPGGFGSAEFTGVTDYVNGNRDLGVILDELAQIQDEALSE